MRYTKQEVKERIREAIRQERIARDQGDSSAHDRVLHLTSLLNRVSKMSAGEIVAFTQSHAGFEE